MGSQQSGGLAKWREDLSAKKRRDILSAATTLFKKKGLHATSAVALAKLAHASTATIYKHFSSKEEIFAACVDAHLVKSDDGSIDTQEAEGFLEEVSRAMFNEIILPNGYGDATKALKEFISK